VRILTVDFGWNAIPIYRAAQLTRNTLGGISTERGLVHEMRLMVMHSNVIVCWRVLRQPYRDEQRIRAPSCAEVISGDAILSCPMHSNANACWRGSSQTYRVPQAFERQRVPDDRRQRDRVLPQVARLVLPPNRRLQLTPLRGHKIVRILEAEFVPIAISIY
jgi:hypothetical protein